LVIGSSSSSAFWPGASRAALDQFENPRLLDVPGLSALLPLTEHIGDLSHVARFIADMEAVRFRVVHEALTNAARRDVATDRVLVDLKMSESLMDGHPVAEVLVGGMAEIPRFPDALFSA
jgi:hypothetical protein